MEPAEQASMEDKELVRCTFHLGSKNLGTFFVRSDLELGATFKYEFPAEHGVYGEREKVGLRILRLQKVIEKGSMYYIAEVAPVSMTVLPPNW
jgi:hypothetical protein